jgi:hypothetical protein
MPDAPPEVLERLRAPREPRRPPSLVPAGANAFDVMRLNARAPAISRASPDSFVQAVHEWRGLSLDAFRRTGKGHWAVAVRSAYDKRLYVVDMVRRSFSMLPALQSSLMTSDERENWAAARFDHLRLLQGESMTQYVDHMRLLDPNIKRRKSTKRRREEEDETGGNGAV